MSNMFKVNYIIYVQKKQNCKQKRIWPTNSLLHNNKEFERDRSALLDALRALRCTNDSEMGQNNQSIERM